MAHSPSHSMSEDPSLQRYLLLASQEEVLRRRLSLQIPSASPMTANSPEMQSLSSPHSMRPGYSPSWTAEPDSYSPTSPTFTRPVPTHPGVTHQHSVDERHQEDSSKMYEINQQIKATLTELLNTDSVRADDKYRAWIQERLMDVERQIRKYRRRRSSIDPEVVRSIAEHFEHDGFHFTP